MQGSLLAGIDQNNDSVQAREKDLRALQELLHERRLHHRDYRRGRREREVSSQSPGEEQGQAPAQGDQGIGDVLRHHQQGREPRLFPSEVSYSRQCRSVTAEIPRRSTASTYEEMKASTDEHKDINFLLPPDTLQSAQSMREAPKIGSASDNDTEER